MAFAGELARFFIVKVPMDKKSKKRIEVLRKRLEKQKQILSFAKQQTDEPDEVENVEKQIEETINEIDKLKNG